LNLPPKVVGAFSCHGARADASGAVQAKVNQDCAVVCYPFGPRATAPARGAEPRSDGEASLAPGARESVGLGPPGNVGTAPLGAISLESSPGAGAVAIGLDSGASWSWSGVGDVVGGGGGEGGVGRESCALFSVLDGHGEDGEVISRFVAMRLGEHLQAERQLVRAPELALRTAFDAAQAELDADEEPGGLSDLSEDSGACCVLALLLGQELWIANAGESRHGSRARAAGICCAVLCCAALCCALFCYTV
jgi:hypothetical protein